ncbi:MAG: hypothetical protein ACRDG4_19820, partial [Chloroflexota bacterium]
GIRHAACAEESITVRPRGLDPEATYTLENTETGETREIGGSNLARAGFTFELPRRSGTIWLYSLQRR